MILLAVSGGIDSMYMADRAPELFSGALFAVAHCNFTLRGAESDGDEMFVKAWCQKNNIRFHSIRFNTSDYAREKGISIEMAARQLRYEWFRDLCLEYGYDGVAVAHNANDNAETLILNLLRGTGSKGVRGMAEKSVLPVEKAEGLYLLRPLLGISREEIKGWMLENNNSWREDCTNSENDVKRNVIRNTVFPIFAQINPSYIQTLNADIKRLRQVDDIAEDWYMSVRNDILDEDGGIVTDKLLCRKHWEYLLFRMLEGCSLSNETFGKLIELLEKYRTRPRGTVTIGGKCFESSSGVVRIEKGRILFLPFNN